MGTKHIVIDGILNTYKCNRCGAREAMPKLPISIDKFIEAGKVFTEKHKKCKKNE